MCPKIASSKPQMVLLLCALWPIGLAQADTPAAALVDDSQLFALAAQHIDLVVVDVRLRLDYQRAHIPGAVNLPSGELDHTNLAASVADKNTPMVFYCNGTGCDRSHQALHKAHALGYRQLYWFKDGMQHWQEQNYAYEHQREWLDPL